MNQIYQALAEIEKSHKIAALCTVIKTSGSTPRHATSKMLVYNDGHILGTVGGGELENRVRMEAMESLIDRKPRLLSYSLNDPTKGDVGTCGGQVEIFVEPLLPPPTIIVVGGGHVGKAVAHLAKWLRFQVVVSDDRPELCTPEENPDADMFLPISMSDLPFHIDINPQTIIILTTRGSQVDVTGLPALLKTPAGYIGVIGSRKRWTETCNQLRKKGVSDEQLKRVHSPIGLGLGAETPEEIAVSIMAEVIMIFKGGSGKQMN